MVSLLVAELKGGFYALCIKYIYIFLYISSGQEDDVAEYYQQQVEVLEGFNEMDALAERGFIPGMSKVSIWFFLLSSLDLWLIYTI